MGEPKDGCVAPAKGRILKLEGQPSTPSQDFKEEPKMTAYKGKWVALCFYSGDFAFV